MTSLREKIQALRRESADSRSSFIPAGSLDEILTSEEIRSALRTCKAHLHRENESVEMIRCGGQKTFAILIAIYRPELIISFVENDQLQTTKIDWKLPYSKADLDRIIPEADAVDFFEKQWEFTAPIFKRRAGHRCLHQRTIFPFLDSAGHGLGASGDVFKVKLHRSHGIAFKTSYNQGHLNVAKKQLRADQEDPDGFERECRVLSLLNCLEHPNIVELFGSYTCNGVHNLIFPIAEYDLDQILSGAKSSPFDSEADYLLALCGLASALEKLHTFVSEDLKVSLIGCHHDLRPHNVLIKDRRLLLADFGLSSLKEVTKGSKTSWKQGDARYLAPECEDPEREFRPGIIGRKSDIWSFGCILAEVATYMARGAPGVKEFTECRKVTLAGRWTVKTFHAGRDPNKGVQAWLASLEQSRSGNEAALIQIVNEMLKIEPDDRPTAQHATQELRRLAMTSKFLAVDHSFGIQTDQSKHLDMTIEKARFMMWGRTMGVAGTCTGEAREKGVFWSDDLFQRQFNNVGKIEQEIGLGVEAQEDFHARVTRLRMINDDMLHELPHASQVRIISYLEQKMVNTEDLDLLQQLKKTFDETSQYRSIGTLAAIKYMHQLCNSPSDGHGRRMQLDSVSWAPSEPSVHFAIGMLHFRDRPPSRALVEKIKYEEHWVDDVGDEMYNRIGAVAELLRTTRSDKDMRVLPPIGYFHQPVYRSFGLAFHIPHSPEADKDRFPEVITLRRYMEATQRIRPSLGERILLARRLASALARIHKVKWLHKGISACSIILLVTSQSDPPARIPSPYITGFNYSRPSIGFSDKSGYPLEVLDYRHPEYAKEGQRVRYTAKFDYYSLGLVLLEIGLWKSLSRMTRGKEHLAPDGLLDYILQEHVTQLDFYVGTSYREIVTMCLKGELGLDIDEQISNLDDLTTFESTETVEEQLASCLI